MSKDLAISSHFLLLRLFSVFYFPLDGYFPIHILAQHGGPLTCLACYAGKHLIVIIILCPFSRWITDFVASKTDDHGHVYFHLGTVGHEDCNVGFPFVLFRGVLNIV